MNFERALCNLRASVSWMPLSICKKLDIGEINATNISLQLSDQSIKYLIIILEDILIRIGQLFIPPDFVIMEMEEDSKIQILLGTPFLVIIREIIDFKKGKPTFGVGG